MAEYISRNEAINAIKSLESSMPAKDNYAKGYDAALGRALIAVREAPPAADVQSVEHGKWKNVAGMNSKCSVCSHYFPVTEFDSRPFDINYCPNCGARMDGGNEDENG